jgi:hypothetical protein
MKNSTLADVLRLERIKYSINDTILSSDQERDLIEKHEKERSSLELLLKEAVEIFKENVIRNLIRRSKGEL